MEVKWSRFIQSMTRHAIFENVPTSPGIYMLYEELSDGSQSCIYVNETGNLALTLLNYLLNSEKNKCVKNCLLHNICGFRFAVVLNKQTRQGVVKFIIQTWTPKGNKSNPNLNPIKVNLHKADKTK